MEHARRRSPVVTGLGRQVGDRTARGWVKALVLVGIWAGAAGTAAENAGHHRGWVDGSEARELHHTADCRTFRRGVRHNPCPVEPDTEPDWMKGPDTSREARVDCEDVRGSAVNTNVSPRTGDVASLCESPGHLCDLVAAHFRSPITRFGPMQYRAEVLGLAEQAISPPRSTTVERTIALNPQQWPE